MCSGISIQSTSPSKSSAGLYFPVSFLCSFVYRSPRSSYFRSALSLLLYNELVTGCVKSETSDRSTLVMIMMLDSEVNLNYSSRYDSG